MPTQFAQEFETRFAYIFGKGVSCKINSIAVRMNHYRNTQDFLRYDRGQAAEASILRMNHV
jgi:hypothetical protein